MWLMLVWIPVGFAILVAAAAGENWLMAALLANFFHAVGVLVGLVSVLAMGARRVETESS